MKKYHFYIIILFYLLQLVKHEEELSCVSFLGI